jgi:hypothetical protein
MAWKNKVRCCTGELAGDYFEYLETEHWSSIKKQAFRIHGMKCYECGLHDNLQIHHRHYKTLGKEDPQTDLMPLCYMCHKGIHNRDDEAVQYKIKTRKAEKRRAQSKIDEHLRREKMILNQKTKGGGFNKHTLAGWGVPWPPPKGWKETLVLFGFPYNHAKNRQK